MSVRCLLALLEDEDYEILVGLDGGGTLNVLRTTWTRHGSLGLLRRIRRKLRAKVRGTLCRLGYPLGQGAVDSITNPHCQISRLGASPGFSLLGGSKKPGLAPKRLIKSTVPQPESLTEILAAYRLEAVVCEDVNSTRIADEIARFDPQLIVVANFSQILRRSLLDLPPLGVINLHPSLLPKYRGPTPYYWVLRNREPVSGVTVHYVDRKVDAGDIVAQVDHAVHSDDTEESLRQRSVSMAAPLLAAATRDILRGTARRVPQDAKNATYHGFPPRGASRL